LLGLGKAIPDSDNAKQFLGLVEEQLKTRQINYANLFAKRHKMKLKRIMQTFLPKAIRWSSIPRSKSPKGQAMGMVLRIKMSFLQERWAYAEGLMHSRTSSPRRVIIM
jgi:hypothetical protein